MAYFNLPFSLRISNNNPVDGDRYIASDISARDQLITDGRAYEGLQVYDASAKILYLLNDISENTWEIVGSDSSALADLQNYIDGSLNIRDLRLDNLDTSVGDLDILTQAHTTDIANLDTSVGDLDILTQAHTTGIANLDTSVGDLDIKTQNLDVSINNISFILDASIQELNQNKLNNTTDVFTGTLTLDGDINIGGNLTVNGSTYIVGTETIDVSSGFIYLNTGLSGTPPSTMKSGIIVDRGDLDPYAFLYDEIDQTFRIGTIVESTLGYIDFSSQAVATREDNPLSNSIPFWNSTENRFDTSTYLKLSSGYLYIGGLQLRDSGSYGELRYEGNTGVLLNSTSTRLSAPSASNAVNLSASSIFINHPESIALGNISDGDDYVSIRDPHPTTSRDYTLQIHGSAVSGISSVAKFTSDGSILFPAISESSTNKILFYNETDGAVTYGDAIIDPVITEKTSNYILTSSDNNDVIDASGTFTLTLPDNLQTGFQFTVVNAGLGVITLDASNLLTTGGLNTITDQYGGVSAVHKGSGTWYAWGSLA